MTWQRAFEFDPQTRASRGEFRMNLVNLTVLTGRQGDSAAALQLLPARGRHGAGGELTEFTPVLQHSRPSSQPPVCRWPSTSGGGTGAPAGRDGRCVSASPGVCPAAHAAENTALSTEALRHGATSRLPSRAGLFRRRGGLLQRRRSL